MEAALVGLKENPVDGVTLLSAPTPIVLPPKLNAVMGAEGLNPPTDAVEVVADCDSGASFCEMARGAWKRGCAGAVIGVCLSTGGATTSFSGTSTSIPFTPSSPATSPLAFFSPLNSASYSRFRRPSASPRFTNGSWRQATSSARMIDSLRPLIEVR